MTTKYYGSKETSEIIQHIPCIAYGDFVETTNLAITTTPTIVSGFSEEITPIGMSQSGGVFTIDSDVCYGVYEITIERVFENFDTNPTDVVYFTVDVQIDGVSEFTRTLPASTATKANEPSVLPFTTTIIREIAAGGTFSIYVYGNDNGATPSNASLVYMRVSIRKIYKS